METSGFKASRGENQETAIVRCVMRIANGSVVTNIINHLESGTLFTKKGGELTHQ